MLSRELDFSRVNRCRGATRIYSFQRKIRQLESGDPGWKQAGVHFDQRL